MNAEQEMFQSNPREYAMELIDEGAVTPRNMVLALLKAMSHSEIRDALDANEYSPRFDE